MMRILVTVMALLSTLALGACNLTLKGFLNSGDPCGYAEKIHAAFLVFAAHTPKVGNNAKLMRAERTGIAGVREYCSSGAVDKPTLERLVASYAAAVTEYKK